MRKLIFIFSMLIAITGSTQTQVFPMGNATSVQQNRGGALTDSMNAVCVRGFHSLYPTIRMIGRVQVYKGDSCLYYHDGTNWINLRDYSTLKNKPSIPAAQVQTDWNATSGMGSILNKPSLFSGSYNDLTNKPTLFDGQYSSLSGKPTLFSGSYLDLTNKPTIPSAQVQTDWNASSGTGVLLNKPTLFSGVYSDLTGKPTLFSGVYSDLTGKPTLFSGVYSDLTGKPSFSAVATSGQYSDLIGKPSLATVATSGSYNDLTGKPIPDYTNTTAVSGGAGNVVFYLTSDKTSTGTALFSNVTTVIPLVNDASTNYTYGWTYNSTTKALTVNVKSSPGLVVGVLTLLGVPVNVANGTNVQILVKGN